MFGSSFKTIFGLVLVLGVIIEIDNAYKHAMDISNIVMPAAPLLQLPEAAHNLPFAETPFVQQFDGMLLTSGTVIFYPGLGARLLGGDDIR